MRKKILWVDDEIEYLRSLVAFMETRGYSVTPVSGGDEALRLIREKSCSAYDIVLLDRQMPVKSGGATLEEIKAICPDLPVVMLSGCQHSNDAVISKKYDGYVSKPVDPNRLLNVCKEIFDSRADRMTGPALRKLSDAYLRDYAKNKARLGGALKAADWMEFYGSLAKWDIEIDCGSGEGVRQMHAGLKSDSGKKFCDFVVENYAEWVSGGPERPFMAVDALERAVVPELRKGGSVLMVVLSGMRMDQFLAIEPELKRNFSTSRARFMSALPTTPEWSLPALVSGRYPGALQLELAICDRHAGGVTQDPALMKNLMRAGLDRAGFDAAKTFFANADGAAGKRQIKSAIDSVGKAQTFAVVALNMADRFMSAEFDAAPPGKGDGLIRSPLAESPPDEAALREEIKSWFAGSEILGMMKKVCDAGCAVILTSDHGRVACGRASEIYETPKLSGTLRCMFADNVSVDEREVFLLEELPHFGLPQPGSGTKCVMARENYYFILPGGRSGNGKNARVYQCGGVSFEEMVMPIYICRSGIVR